MLKNRTHAILLGLLLLLPTVSNALSLGNIKVKSDFAQPFFAEIDIPSYTSDELESLEVKLASAEKFETLGLEISSFMQEFKFLVEQKPNGTPFIKVFTKRPVKELSISFVIEVSWLGGKIIKDYHILLTPEAITELREEQLMQKQLAQIETARVSPLEAVEATASSKSEKVSSQQAAKNPLASAAQAPRRTTVDAPGAATPASSKKQARASSKLKKFGANGVQYVRVKRGESLSKIAVQMRSDNSASLNQIMVTLYEQNLDAFVDKNINKLKAGSTLTVKNIADFKKKSRKEAFVLANQYLNNLQPEASPETVIATAPEAPLAETKVESPGNRLEISSASEEPVPPEIMAKLKQEQIATTEEELRFAKETAESLQAQNEALTERITILESRMDEMAMQLLPLEEEVPTSAPHSSSGSQQVDNLIVTNTDFVLPEEHNLAFLERIQKYQTAISISSLLLLFVILLIMRKKDQLREILANFKAS